MKFRLALISFVFLLLLALPSTSAAAVSSCSELKTTSTGIMRNLALKVVALEQAHIRRLEELSKDWQDQDKEKLIARQKAQSILESSGIREDLKGGLESAARARETSIDATTNEFRARVKTLVQERSANIHAAVLDFNQKASMAFESAQKACNAGSRPAVVIRNLRADLQAARVGLEENMRMEATATAEISSLIAHYKARVSAITEDFKKVVLNLK